MTAAFHSDSMKPDRGEKEGEKKTEKEKERDTSRDDGLAESPIINERSKRKGECSRRDRGKRGSLLSESPSFSCNLYDR